MINLILLFIIYGLLGWIVEVCYVRIGSGHWYNRGFLHMPFLPIYAFGALLITLSLQNFNNPLLVYIFGVLVTSILEYFTSFVMERLFHTRWWDYSSYRFNINGRICLKNSLLFGILSLFVIYGLNPVFSTAIDSVPLSIKSIIADVFIALLMIDLAYTLRNVSNMPIRDIRIISGKVKAYRDGKLRSLDDFLEELDEYRHNSIGFRDDLKDYTRKLNEKHDIHNILITILGIVLIGGLIIKNIIALELIAIIVIIVVALYVYNRTHKKKN